MKFDKFEERDHVNRKFNYAERKKKHDYEEEDLDELDIVAEDVSNEILGLYGIHSVTASKTKNAVVVYIDVASDLPTAAKKEIENMVKPFSLVIKESKLKSDKQHLEDIIKD
jgi:hypothetical protein